MKIVYRPAAVQDIIDTSDYIENKLKNPHAAYRFKEQIVRGISLLKENPNMGALLADKLPVPDGINFRYFIINKQIVFYEIIGETLEIVRVLDGRTDYVCRLF